MQNTSTILMVKPACFGYNEGTALDNAFQHRPEANSEEIKRLAISEFEEAVKKLRNNQIDILEIEDSNDPVTPDAIFPNNWFSTHADGTFILYPMAAPVRRLERRNEIIDLLNRDFYLSNQIDYSKYENEDLFLEGTGSMILDRENNICYAALSQRTNERLIDVFCEDMGFKKVIYNAQDKEGNSIYHTNVIMSVAERFSVICSEIILDEKEKEKLFLSLKQNSKEVIDISFQQVLSFAGNVLEVKNMNGERIFVMSESAYNSLDESQKAVIENHDKIVSVSIPTIERIGGGGIRCMMAEIFLKRRENKKKM